MNLRDGIRYAVRKLNKFSILANQVCHLHPQKGLLVFYNSVLKSIIITLLGKLLNGSQKKVTKLASRRNIFTAIFFKKFWFIFEWFIWIQCCFLHYIYLNFFLNQKIWKIATQIHQTNEKVVIPFFSSDISKSFYFKNTGPHTNCYLFQGHPLRPFPASKKPGHVRTIQNQS